MIYLSTLLFTLAFVLYSKWQFSDDKGQSQGKWHSYGMVMRILVVVSSFLPSFFPSTWQDFVLAGALNIVFWEIGINVIALKQHWLYIGTTSKLDIKFGKAKWIVYFAILLIAILIKILIK